MAFGTGLHATTVLFGIDGKAYQGGEKVVDVGTGREYGHQCRPMGAAQVTAIDVDRLQYRQPEERRTRLKGR